VEPFEHVVHLEGEAVILTSKWLNLVGLKMNDVLSKVKNYFSLKNDAQLS